MLGIYNLSGSIHTEINIKINLVPIKWYQLATYILLLLNLSGLWNIFNFQGYFIPGNARTSSQSDLKQLRKGHFYVSLKKKNNPLDNSEKRHKQMNFEAGIIFSISSLVSFSQMLEY